MTRVAYLIHGTYATNAPWTGPGATFYEALQAKFGNDLAIRTFSWDGKNAFSSRHEAIHRLSNELDTVAAEKEFRDIYLVAHSHGGNIALHATSQMQHGERITALVSLGTPYLRVAPKSWAPPALLAFGLSFWLSLGLSAFVPKDLSGTSVILFLLLLPTMYWLLVRAKRRSYALRNRVKIKYPISVRCDTSSGCGWKVLFD